jgi:hypothetical protein
MNRCAREFETSVVSGLETLLDEMYPDSTSAIRHAIQVRDRLLRSGDWANVSDQPASSLRAS